MISLTASNNYSFIELEYLRTAIETEEKVFELLAQPAELFQTELGAILYAIIHDLTDQATPITTGAIAVELERRGHNPRHLGQYLEFVKMFPRRDHENLANILVERKALADRYAACREICQLVSDKKISSEQIDIKFSEIIQGAPDKVAGVTIKELSALDLDEIFSKTTYTKTGIDKLDELIKGFFTTQLVVVAARPGRGKSSLALQIAEGMQGNTLYFSLEMNRREMYARVLSRYAEVESWKIVAKKLNDVEMPRVINAHRAVAPNIKIKLYDKMSDVSKIINEIKRVARKGNLSAVFIDYLQLLKGGKGENQNLRIGDITGKLKSLAMEIETPIVLLSQLSRENEKEGRAPQLSDLRESGNIEQDADVVLFIHDNEFIIAKNRNGKTGKFNIEFEKQYFRFESGPALSERHQAKLQYIHY